jgi:bis(5'-nucleosidyl)-tetraphosphatase
MRFEKSAGAVIFRINPENKIEYLGLDQFGKWSFSKGKMNRNEQEKETAKREIYEETGIKIKEFIPGFMVKNYKLFRAPERNYKWTFKKFIYFLAYVENCNIKLSSEHQGYDWFSLEDALIKMKDIENLQKIIIKANYFIIHMQNYKGQLND